MVPSPLADQEPGSRGRAAIAACPGLRRKTEQDLVRASSGCRGQVPDREAGQPKCIFSQFWVQKSRTEGLAECFL